jgi:flavin reductase (DIM6/NTAB) family NADH-FMN oxidoreductase RutF
LPGFEQLHNLRKEDQIMEEKNTNREYWKPSNLLYPVPAVIVTSADGEGHTDMMTAAWAGTVCSDPVMVSVSIRPSRLTHDYIEKTGEFVINLTTRELAYATDWVGVKSGRDVDKWKEMNLTPLPSQKVSVPGIKESPVCLECVVRQKLELGTHDMYVAEVLSTDVDTSLLDEKGRLDLEKADLIAYSHGEYFTLGEKLGKFGFSVKKN